MTEYANQADATKVSDAYEAVKKKVSAGTHPTEALREVAKAGGLTPDHVTTIGETLNQTISGSVNLGTEPHENFDTADIDAVVNEMKSPKTDIGEDGKKAESKKPATPNNDFSIVGTLPKESPTEKTASAVQVIDKVPSIVDLIMWKNASLSALSRFNQSAEAKFQQVEAEVEKFASLFALSPAGARQQAIYAMMGEDADMADVILKEASLKYGVDLDGVLEKEASLPEICSDAADVGVNCVRLGLDYSRAVVAQKDAEDICGMVKVAADSLSSVVNTLGGVAGVDLGLTSEDYAPNDTKIEPEYLNKMRGLRAVEGFHNMLIFDKDVGKYEPHAVMDAYNSVVQINPGAADNPAILRNLVLDRLAKGNMVDPMSIQNEQKIGLSPLEASKTRGEIASNAAKMKLLNRPAEPGANNGAAVRGAIFGGIDSAAGGAKKVMGAAAGALPSSTDFVSKPSKDQADGDGDELDSDTMTKVVKKSRVAAGAMTPSSNTDIYRSLHAKGMDTNAIGALLQKPSRRTLTIMAKVLKDPSSGYDLAARPDLSSEEAAALVAAGANIQPSYPGMFFN